MSQTNVASLVAEGRLSEAVELALEQPTGRVIGPLLGARAGDQLQPFLDGWLAALPPLERLQAAAPLAEREQLLRCHAAAALTFATELRDFWSFTDSPDAEVAPAIMDRFGRYADQMESMSFDPASSVREEVRPACRPQRPGSSDDDLPFEPHPVLPAAENELMTLIADGRQAEAVRLALDHRESWVEVRLDYDAVETNDGASSAFLQAWLPALPPLERLQAASWAASSFQLALVQLEHSYGTGAQLLLEAMAAAASCWAGLLRDIVAESGASDGAGGEFSARLLAHADQLDAMSFEPVPIEQPRP